MRRCLQLCLLCSALAGVMGLAIAQVAGGDLNARFAQDVCTNLAQETRAVLNDAGDTHKYLSPYIAQDLYQGVVSRTLAALPSGVVPTVMVPEMSALPCQDTVSDFMMGIKQRMEYGRFDRMLLDNRVRIALFGLLALMGLVVHWRWWRKPKAASAA